MLPTDTHVTLDRYAHTLDELDRIATIIPSVLAVNLQTEDHASLQDLAAKPSVTIARLEAHRTVFNSLASAKVA